MKFKKNIRFTPFVDEDVVKELRLVRKGIDPLIITIDGFLSDDDAIDNEWEEAINRFYPNNTWYHLKWKSKSKIDLVVNSSATMQILGLVIPQTRFPSILATAINTWYKAYNNSKKAGEELAEILLNHNRSELILMGHSLGGSVIYNCLKELSNKNLTIINEVHILGGAVNSSIKKWGSVKQSVKYNIFNYFSKNDKILKYSYSVSTTDRFPSGRNKIDINGIINLDVTGMVDSHMSFKKEFKNIIENSILHHNPS